MKSRIALNTGNLPIAAFPAVFQINIDAVGAHPAVFAVPDPSLPSCQAANDALMTKLSEISALEVQLALAREERDQLAEDDLARRSELAIYVAGVAKGDAAVLLLAGFDLAAPPGPAQPMGKVQGNRLTASADAGAATGEWLLEPGAKSYEVALAPDGNDGPWTFYKVVTGTRVEITDGTSGHKCWSRVRAINKLGPGPWSDPAFCMIG